MSRKIPIFYSALMLTGVNLLLRFVGTSFQVYLSGSIGAAGIGLVQLVMSVGVLAMVAGMGGIRTGAMYLAHEGKNAYVCAIPATFMTAVTMTFVFNSKLYLGAIPFLPPISKILGIGIAAVLLILFILKAPKGEKLAK